MDTSKLISFNFLTADKKRELGNQMYQNSQFYDAICFYNESLLQAKTLKSNSLLSLAYANRSAVFFTVKQYELCLENIKLAKEHGYQADKLPTLDVREKKCNDILAHQKAKDPADDATSFFKLSYPANNKIPFIISCLEMRETEQYGRGIYTNKDLKPGDIVAIEKPFMFLTYGDFRRCANCFKSNMMSLIPDDNFKMFCSQFCLQEFRQRAEKFSDLPLYGHPLHEIIYKALEISGGYEELASIYSDPKPSTIFDYDLSNPDDPETQRNLLRCAASLRQYELDSTDYSKVVNAEIQECLRFVNAMKISSRSKDVLNLFARRFTLITAKSGVGVVLKKVNHGRLVLFVIPLLNHSCDPNVAAAHENREKAVIVKKPIKAGEQLFMSYGPIFWVQPKRIRQERMATYQFKCECKACDRDFPSSQELLYRDPRFSPPDIQFFGTVKESIKELKRNWRYLEKNINLHPSIETCSLLERSSNLISHIGNIAYCPFI